MQASEAEQREQSAKVMARAQKLREHLEQERASLRTQVPLCDQRSPRAHSSIGALTPYA